MKKTPNYPVPALEKGLDILETLAAAAVPQSLAELATQLNRSSSELFRMLNCLVRRGYVTRDPVSTKFGLSLKLFALSHTHSVIEKLLQAARLPLQSLAEKSRESAHLSVLDEDKLLVIAQQESADRVRLSIEVGGQFNPLLTASGRLLLAHLEESRLANILDETDLSAKKRTELKGAFTKMRRTGVSVAESETIEGVRDLAVLVGNPDVGAIAALAITRLLRRGQRTDEAALIEDMKTTAAQITETLGLTL